MEKKHHISRRDFLKGSAISAAALAGSGFLAGCQPTVSSAQAPVQWDEETDVVVIGGGGAGLTAAIEAVETGEAKVILLEKAAVVGGSTTLSGGVIQASATSYQREFAGVEDDTPEKHAEFWTKEGEGLVDPALVSLMAAKAPEAIEWLVAHGLDYVDVYGVSRVPNVDPSLNVKRIHVPAGQGTTARAGTGAVHTAALLSSAQAKGVDIRTESPAMELVVDENNAVLGVKASIEGTEKFIKANRGVVIATSGFDHNTEMARAMSPQQLWELETGMCITAPTNTGDGIKLGMSVGADLAGLGGTIGVPGIAMGAAALNQEIAAVPGIWVNKYGQRFVDEASHYAYAIRAVFNQEDHIAWAIFDQSVVDLGGAALGGIWGPMSDGLVDEIAAGRAFKAETLEELAEAIGVNGAQLVRTMEAYNNDMKNGGVDTLFGKTEGLAPMEKAPYYAMKVFSVNLGTCGGLKINTDCQVIDVNGNPIPHLFAAGMVAGGFIGPYYPGSGTAICATAVFGRIAGASAAKQAA